jgi:hypothetical protein
VNQQGDPLEPSTSVTYAIWGPWKRRGDPHKKIIESSSRMT